MAVMLHISNIKLQELAYHSSLNGFQHSLNPCQGQKEAWRLCLSDVCRHPHLHTHIWTVRICLWLSGSINYPSPSNWIPLKSCYFSDRPKVDFRLRWQVWSLFVFIDRIPYFTFAASYRAKAECVCHLWLNLSFKRDTSHFPLESSFSPLISVHSSSQVRVLFSHLSTRAVNYSNLQSNFVASHQSNLLSTL